MSTMANLYCALFFYFFIATSFTDIAGAASLSFTFPPQTDIELFPNLDAKFQGDTIQLTKYEVGGNQQMSTGWATYSKAVPLWNNSSLANFSTHFQFIIRTVDGNGSAGGDGLAFFMAPLHFQPPPNSNGYWLALFNETTDGDSSNQIVAVEFDTFKNKFDPDDNHVGIDVNRIVSKVNVSLNQSLKSGKYWDAWVDYDGGIKQLQVFLLYNPSGNTNNISKPRSPILRYDVDVRDFLPENIKIGLSAATGQLIETHTIYSWNFSCDYLWETSPASPVYKKPGKNSKKTYVKVILISGVLACFLGVCCVLFLSTRCYFNKMKRGNEAAQENEESLDEFISQGPHKFSYMDLSVATRNFSDDEKLGEGGFGAVYKGILPAQNEAVAVKKISRRSKQGKKEYIAEVTIISKLRHRNLVQLLGWCHEKGELLLVYQFLANGSLDQYIFGEAKGYLDWDRRYSIACDISSALVYLHEECDQRVVHRDVKASNVMLDSDFNAKLGDFGLARVVDRNQGASYTTVVAGTLGFIAPECVITGKASVESDVFSFGAVALEISCGRRPFDSRLIDHNCRLVEWVWDLYGQGKLLDAVDERLGGNFNGEEMELLMSVGLLCSHPDPKLRPTMREVSKILKLEAQLPSVPLNLPVAVYDEHVRLHVRSSSNERPRRMSFPLLSEVEPRT